MNFSLLPRIVYQAKSKISGEIVVKKQFWQFSLHVDGLIQSGGIVKGIWQKPIRVAKRRVPKIKRVLVLGLGGGTVVRLIKKAWPEAEITGVDIDPVVIKIGKKYFGLDKVPGLKIVNEDAFQYMAETPKKYNLIIVDLYLGHLFPSQAETNLFLKRISRGLLPSGLVIINRLKDEKANLRPFEKKVERHFFLLEKIKTSTNLFFICFQLLF